MRQLKIDPEFRDKIPPLTEAEFQQLRENILDDGEVYEPIITWNDTIVDGHNRWRVICENWDLLKDHYRVKEMAFTDKWDALDWMCKKQLGRRNLTDEQRTVLIGKMYEARKNSHGGDRRQSGEASAQIGHMARTVDIIAKELGIGKETVKRAEKFAKGIEALRETDAEAADKVLQGNAGVTKAVVMEIPMMGPEERESVAEAIKTGAKKSGWTIADRKAREDTKAIVEDMMTPDVPKYTVDDLVREIELDAAEFVAILRTVLTEHSTLLTADAREKVAEAIEREAICEIKKVKELIR